MVREATWIITDDLNPEVEGYPRTFSFEGTYYSIDLGTENYLKLKELLAPFMNNGQRGGRYVVSGTRAALSGISAARRGRPGMDPALAKRIREDAAAAGKPVSPRGKIPEMILTWWYDTHAAELYAEHVEK